MENGVIDDTLFATGMLRSGTTLLEKLLSTQRGVSMLSQPFPLLFVEAKHAFLRTRGVAEERYPLGHLFLESRYEAASLGEFLRRWRASPGELAELFARMREYSGQRTRFTDSRLKDAFSKIDGDDDFAGVVAKLDRLLAADADAHCFGSKETFCEELVPFLLDRGLRCAIIIRDPRDVVASLNHGRGREFGGEIKPTLFNVRSWRKSVAVALAMERRPRFHWCRYEDLAADPAGTLSRLAEALELDALDPARLGDLQWGGNSSFSEHGGVSAASVGVHRGVLPSEVAEEIEATCLPELRLLRYDSTMTTADAVRVIHRFREPYGVRREGMERDLATADNAALEEERLERLTAAGLDVSPWFLFERAAARLREASPPKHRLPMPRER